MSASALEAILRRDRAIVIAALGLLAIFAWADLVWLSKMTDYRMLPAGQGLMMPASAPWQPVEFAYVFVMWVVMMIGMMAPSATPMILVHARAARQLAMQGKPLAATAWFGGGYLLAWITFSFAATLGGWALERASVLTPMMAAANPVFAGTVLIAVGLYQWTPLKEACLSQCQAPLSFILRHGGLRSTPTGSLILGLRHGVYCVGCCWALMLLLFVFGVMNLLWMSALAILIMLEKVVPFGRAVARLAGLLFIALGGWLLVAHM